MPTRRSHHKNPQSTGSGELLGWWDRKCWEAGPPGKGLEAKQLLPHRWPCASLSPGGSSVAFILCPGKRVSLSSLCRSSKLSGGALESPIDSGPKHRQQPGLAPGIESGRRSSLAGLSPSPMWPHAISTQAVSDLRWILGHPAGVPDNCLVGRNLHTFDGQKHQKWSVLCEDKGTEGRKT